MMSEFPSYPWFAPEVLAVASTGPALSCIQSRSPVWWQDLRHLSHHHWLPRACVSRKLTSAREVGVGSQSLAAVQLSSLPVQTPATFTVLFFLILNEMQRRTNGHIHTHKEKGRASVH